MRPTGPEHWPLAVCLVLASVALEASCKEERIPQKVAQKCVEALATADGVSRSMALATLTALSGGAGGDADDKKANASAEEARERGRETSEDDCGRARDEGAAARNRTAAEPDKPGVRHAAGSGRPSPTVALAAHASASGSPIAASARSLNEWLQEASYQLIIAVIAILTGLAFAWNGPAIWRFLFTAVVTLVVAGVARYEAMYWELVPNVASQIMLVGHAAAAAMLAVHVGFEGFQVLLGVALGLVGAYGFGGWARSLDSAVPGIALLWYEAGAVAGFLVYTVWRKPVLATLAPLIGGFLMAAGIGVLLSRTYAVVAGWFGVFGDPVLLPAVHTPLVSAAVALLGAAGTSAVPVHCGCAMLGALLYRCSRFVWLAVGCLVGSIMVSTVAASTGISCTVIPVYIDCPAWLQPVENWQWSLFGSALWATFTAAAAWRQLGLLQDWESNDFWQSEISSACAALAAGSGCAGCANYNLVRQPDMDDGAGSDKNMQTRMPRNYEESPFTNYEQDPLMNNRAGHVQALYPASMVGDGLLGRLRASWQHAQGWVDGWIASKIHGTMPWDHGDNGMVFDNLLQRVSTPIKPTGYQNDGFSPMPPPGGCCSRMRPPDRCSGHPVPRVLARQPPQSPYIAGKSTTGGPLFP